MQLVLVLSISFASLSLGKRQKHWQEQEHGHTKGEQEQEERHTKEKGLSWVSQTDPLKPDDLCLQDRYKAWQALQNYGLPTSVDKLPSEWLNSCDDGTWGLEKDELTDSGECKGKEPEPEPESEPGSVGKGSSDLFCEPNKHCFPNCFHVCQNCTLDYPKEIYGDIPTHGPHRPFFPTWGEYSFLPPQRWLHSIEHGAVVMLYHPCAGKKLVDELRKIVVGCLRKHIIAPSTRFTSEERPLTLVAWLCRMTMAKVNKKEVEDFIRLRALLALEGTYPADGSFKKNLIKKAEDPPHPEVSQVTCGKGKGGGGRPTWPLIDG